MHYSFWHAYTSTSGRSFKAYHQSPLGNTRELPRNPSRSTLFVQLGEQPVDGGGQGAQLVQPWPHVALPPLSVDVRGIDIAELPRKVSIQSGALRPQRRDGVGDRLGVEEGGLARPQLVGVAKGLMGRGTP